MTVQNAVDIPRKPHRRHSDLISFGITFLVTLAVLAAVSGTVFTVFQENLSWNMIEEILTTVPRRSSGSSKTAYGLLPRSDEVDDSYFSDAVFVGDSLTKGMSLRQNVLGFVQGVIGISTYGALHSHSYTLESGYMGNAVDAVLELNPRKVYMMFGTNGISFDDMDERILKPYAEMIDDIHDELPDAVIYIQSIPMPTRWYTANVDSRFRVNTVVEYNQKLLDLAREKECYFLDTYSELCTDDGYLPRELCNPDGLHINNDGYDIMFDYIRTHTVRN